MARLYIPNTTIQFIYNGKRYNCYITVIRLGKKAVLRIYKVDNPMNEFNFFEVESWFSPHSNMCHWTGKNMDKDLAQVIGTAIENNPELFKYVLGQIQ